MFPEFSLDNRSNMLRGSLELFGNNGYCMLRKHRSNFDNIGNGKFSHSMIFPAFGFFRMLSKRMQVATKNIFFQSVFSGNAVWCTSFFNHVQSIFFGGSKKKMVWIDTFRNITGMAYNFAIRNFTVKELVNPSSGNNTSTGFVFARPNPKFSVSMAVGASEWCSLEPNPTTATCNKVAAMEATNVCFCLSNHVKQYNRSSSHAQQ